MNQTAHCRLCENQKLNAKGSYCGLTDEKPTFENTCKEVVFEDKLEETIQNINLEYETILNTKAKTIAHFITYLAAGILVMAGGLYIGKLGGDKGVLSTIPLIIMGVGFLLIPVAFGPINLYRSKMGVARQKKNELDALLKLYDITYQFNIEFGRKYHNRQEINVDLKVSKGK